MGEQKGKEVKSYMQAAMLASNNGNPTPTTTPMIILLLTPPVFPSTILVIPEVGPGTYDVGVPLEGFIACALLPKAIVLTVF